MRCDANGLGRKQERVGTATAQISRVWRRSPTTAMFATRLRCATARVAPCRLLARPIASRTLPCTTVAPRLSTSAVAAAFGWLIGVLRSELRALGSLDIVTPRITGRLSEIIGIQAALALIAVSQGIGKDAFFRLGATHLFQLSLIMAWLFSLGIFDVGGVDPHLAVTKMKLSLVESAALFCTGVLVLAGLAAYFLSERSQPDRRAVARLFAIAAFSIIGAYCFTARVVWVARRRRRSKVCDSDPEPPA